MHWMQKVPQQLYDDFSLCFIDNMDNNKPLDEVGQKLVLSLGSCFVGRVIPVMLPKLLRLLQAFKF